MTMQSLFMMVLLSSSLASLVMGRVGCSMYSANDFVISTEHPSYPRFSHWLQQFEIRVETEGHLAHLFRNWVQNDKYIEETNFQNLTYTLGHNQFSGMDEYEFAEFLHKGGLLTSSSSSLPEQGKRQAEAELRRFLRGSDLVNGADEGDLVDIVLDLDQDEMWQSSTTLPLAIDWRALGAVTPVKDQGQCGSCWSFSTTGSLEGAYFVSTGVLQSFSEQELVSCDNFKNGGTNLGCNGGNVEPTLTWVGKQGGICREEDYPYVSGTGKVPDCSRSCSPVSGTTVKKVIEVTANSDTAMMTALVQQPVSVAIEADQSAFQLYKSGVFTGACGANLDHAVLLVGYGTDDSINGGTDYYIMKNSWSASWGEQGYMRMGRGVDPVSKKPYNGGKGQCGVLMSGVYPSFV